MKASTFNLRPAFVVFDISLFKVSVWLSGVLLACHLSASEPRWYGAPCMAIPAIMLMARGLVHAIDSAPQRPAESLWSLTWHVCTRSRLLSWYLWLSLTTAQPTFWIPAQLFCIGPSGCVDLLPKIDYFHKSPSHNLSCLIWILSHLSGFVFYRLRYPYVSDHFEDFRVPALESFRQLATFLHARKLLCLCYFCAPIFAVTLSIPIVSSRLLRFFDCVA